MKKLFGAVILFLLVLALSASAEETTVFLKNQNGTQTTQFAKTDDIYIGGICLPANQGITKIYITKDKIWQGGDEFFDVSMNIDTYAPPGDGRIDYYQPIWRHPLNEGLYDVVIDTNENRKLEEYEMKCVIGLTGAGFQVGNPAPAPTPTPVPTAAPTPVPTLPPAGGSAPAPTPPPASKPSTAFSLNESIEVKSLSNVRKSAGGTLIGSQIDGAPGTIVGGPVQASLDGKNFWFWNIDFENGPDGWVSESTIKSAPVPTPIPTLTPTPTPVPTEIVVPQEPIVSANVAEEETAGEKLVAQVSNPFMGSVVIGIALFFGLIFGSVIIARALRRI